MIKTGFSRVDITLPLGAGLAGYYSPRPAKGVLDPLFLNAVAISNDEQTSLIITVDSLGIYEECCKEIKALIEERTKVAAEHIIINALHQHTSFVLRPKGGTCALDDTTYIDLLYRKFCDVSQMAIDDLEDSEIYYSCAPAIEPISFIRRYRMKDGSIATNPFKNWEDVVEPIGNSDNNVRLLKFVRKNKKDIALVNFCTHPDVIGGEHISADWPGFVRNFVEQEHSDVHCLLANGFQGDVNHFNFQVGPEKRGNGYEYSEKMGRIIADTVNNIWENGVKQEVTKVSAKQSEVYIKIRTDGIEDYPICRKIYDEYQKTSRIPDDAPIKSLTYIRRICDLHLSPALKCIPVSVIDIGNIAFVGLGGEPFSHYAEAIREGAPDKQIITLTCANGFEGYLPTEEAFNEGGYEASASPFTPDLESQCVKEALKLLKNN